MSSIILDQIIGIYRLYADGLKTKTEAIEAAKKTVLYYFGKLETYNDFISELFN